MESVSTTYMNLLHRLTRRVLLSPADGVIEDVYFLHAAVRFLQKLLYFWVVPLSHSGVVVEQLLFRWAVVDTETRLVRGEILLLAANVEDWSIVVILLIGHAGTIHLSPWLACVGVGVDVLEDAGRHVGSLDGLLFGNRSARFRKCLRQL